jgi:hypothetical protein
MISTPCFRPNDQPDNPSDDELLEYRRLVREVAESEMLESKLPRQKILQILKAVGRRPIEFADDVKRLAEPIQRRR